MMSLRGGGGALRHCLIAVVRRRRRRQCHDGSSLLFSSYHSLFLPRKVLVSQNNHRFQSPISQSHDAVFLQRQRPQQRQQQRPLSSSSSSLLSKRELAELEDRLYKAVTTAVVDPVLGKDLATLQWLDRRMAIRSSSSSSTTTTITINLLLRLPSLLHPRLNELKEMVEHAATTAAAKVVVQQQQVKVHVEAIATQPIPFLLARQRRMMIMTNPPSPTLLEQEEEVLVQDTLGPGLAKVSHVVAVYSCKGGVGKSTVAVNLAYQLAHMGGRVGLLDLDVYGPSLPILVKPNDVTIRKAPSTTETTMMVYPIVHERVKLLSLGFVAVNSGVPGSGQDNGAAVMRGPMAGKVVTQLLKGTDWGELDVLILDLPPGTGDVPLQVLQDVSLSGAVAVTTPSKLATVDTKRGMEFFASLGVPTLAVVENMAYFVCEGGGKHFPFGPGLSDSSPSGSSNLSVLLDRTPHHHHHHHQSAVVQLPISPHAINAANESGEPLCLSRPPEETAGEELRAMKRLAEIVCEELWKLQDYSISSTATTSTQSANTSRSGTTTTADQQQAVVVAFGLEAPGDAIFDLETLQLTKDTNTKHPHPHHASDNDDLLTVRLYGASGAIQRRLSPAKLRSRDPQSGAIIPDSPFFRQQQAQQQQQQPSSSAGGNRQSDSMVSLHKVTTVATATTKKKSPSLSVTRVEKKGRYGYAVHFADGVTIIYSLQSLVLAAGGQLLQSTKTSTATTTADNYDIR